MKKILLLGATGFVGKRIQKLLVEKGMDYVPVSLSLGTDLRDKNQFEKVFIDNRDADIILQAAAYVGGIHFGYKHFAEIYYNNSLINTHLFELANKYKIKRIVNPISNCSYPRDIDKAFRESEWWNGEFDKSVFVYGFIRKASYVQSWAYNNQYGLETINLIVPNMYGPEDHFEPERSHALGAMIYRMTNAKSKNEDEFIVWGTGKPIREWLYVDDCVEAMVKAIDIPFTSDPINIGVGYGISISKLAEMIKSSIGYKGKITFDNSKPDGAPFKVMDITRCKEIFNWSPPTLLKDGVDRTVSWFLKNISRYERN